MSEMKEVEETIKKIAKLGKEERDVLMLALLDKIMRIVYNIEKKL